MIYLHILDIEIEWIDIEGEGGWGNTEREFKNMKLATPISVGLKVVYLKIKLKGSY